MESNQYQVNNIIFPSKQVFLTIRSINRFLELLYSPEAYFGGLSKNYSSFREDNEQFENILVIVEKLLDRIKERVVIIEIDNGNYCKEFIGIMDFMDEALSYKYELKYVKLKPTPEYIKKRFISISDKITELEIDGRWIIDGNIQPEEDIDIDY